jgi:glutamine cyclotransferase
LTVARIAAALVASVLLAGAARQPAAARAGGAPTWRHEVVRSFPHDPDAFTQGLLVRDGFLYESTGRKGQSSLRKVEIETGKVVQRLGVGNQYFAEGLGRRTSASSTTAPRSSSSARSPTRARGGAWPTTVRGW